VSSLFECVTNADEVDIELPPSDRAPHQVSKTMVELRGCEPVLAREM
jgi:hypothetical protein